MIDQNQGVDQCEQHLIVLRDELAGRGVRCALEARGVWPRLRIYCPGEGASAEFDNNVVAAPLAGQWFYFWPWAEPVGPVPRLTQAAGNIIEDLGLDNGGPDDSADQPVAGHWPAPPLCGPDACSLRAARSRISELSR